MAEINYESGDEYVLGERPDLGELVPKGPYTINIKKPKPKRDRGLLDPSFEETADDEADDSIAESATETTTNKSSDSDSDSAATPDEFFDRFIDRPIRDIKKPSSGILPTDRRIDSVPGFRGRLMEHQKAVIAALYDLVMTGERTIADGRIIKTNAGILSEELNSGKTVEIICLTLLLRENERIKRASECPDKYTNDIDLLIDRKMRTHIRPIMIRDGPDSIPKRTAQDIMIDGFHSTKSQAYPKTAEIIAEYVPKHIIRPVLIVTSSSTLHKWKDEFARFTNLKIFVVETKPSIERFIDLMTPRKRYNPWAEANDGSSRESSARWNRRMGESDTQTVISIPINDYDVVIIRNGNVTRNLDIIKNQKIPVLGPDHKGPANINIVELTFYLTVYLTKAPWSMVCIDDFDQISLPSGCRGVPAHFTWYISATFRKMSTYRAEDIFEINRKLKEQEKDRLRNAYQQDNLPVPVIKPNVKSHPLYNDPKNPDNIIHKFEHRNYRMMVTDPFLRMHFNVFCKGDFTQQSINPPKVFFYMNVFPNPADHMIRFIGRMGNDNAEINAVLEALNGDAYGAAAAILGIESTNPADMFDRLFSNSYQDLLKAEKQKALIDRHLEAARRLPEGEMTAKEITAITEAIRNGHDVTGLDDNDPNQQNLLNTTQDNQINPNQPINLLDAPQGNRLPIMTVSCKTLIQRIEALQDTAYDRVRDKKTALDRIRSNIRESVCPACNLQIAGDVQSDDLEDAIIMKCCMMVLCSECALRGAHISATSANCAGCKSKIVPKKDMIFINKNFDLAKFANMSLEEAIVKEPVLEDEQVIEPVVEDNQVIKDKINNPVPDNLTEDNPVLKNPKIRCLINLILGNDNPDRRAIESSKITKMFHGTRIIPEPDIRGLKDHRIYMVFATHEESLTAVDLALTIFKIPFARLAGTATAMADTLRNLTKYKVLLVNSTRHCSGIHLAALTDIVEMNRPADASIGRQVRSRFDLIGGNHNCRVHLMYYENEKTAYDANEA